MKLPRLKTTPTRTPLTPAPWAATPADEVAALAAQLDAARGRLELLGGDAAAMLTEVPSEAELAQQRRLAEWRRQELREAERAELSDQLAAAEALRQASKAIRDADIRDAVDARKALAEQRRAETPASTVAELHRYSRATRHGIAAVIAAGMVWSAINVQKNMAPGGMHDPLFWASFLIEGMVSGLLTIIALGSAKVRDTAGIQSGRGTRAAEIGLFLLTLVLNTYPYLRAGAWYQVALHAVAPGMIGAALLVLHSLGADYAAARRIVAQRITGPLQLPELPALHTAHRVPSYRPTPDEVGQRALAETPQPVPVVHPPAAEPVPVPPVPAPVLRVAEDHAAEPGERATTGSEPVPVPVVPVPVPAAVSGGVDGPGEAGLDGVRTRTENPQSDDASGTAPVPEPAVESDALASHDADAPDAEPVASDPAPTLQLPASVVRTRTRQSAAAGVDVPARTRTTGQAVRPASARTTGAGTGGTGASTGEAVVAARREDWLGPMYELAQAVQARGTARTKETEVVARAIAEIDAGATNHAIERDNPLSHKTITHIRETLAEIRAELRHAGGRVIDFPKGTPQ